MLDASSGLLDKAAKNTVGRKSANWAELPRFVASQVTCPVKAGTIPSQRMHWQEWHQGSSQTVFRRTSVILLLEVSHLAHIMLQGISGVSFIFGVGASEIINCELFYVKNSGNLHPKF